MRIPLLVALLSGLLLGCIGGTTGERLVLSENTTKARFYVERQPKDGRDLASLIAEVFVERGFSAAPVEFQQIPADVDFLVTYVDRWQWDLRMYLEDLRIEVRDPESKALLGYGESNQSSLKAMGWSYKDVVERAIDELLGPDGDGQ